MAATLLMSIGMTAALIAQSPAPAQTEASAPRSKVSRQANAAPDDSKDKDLERVAKRVVKELARSTDHDISTASCDLLEGPDSPAPCQIVAATPTHRNRIPALKEAAAAGQPEAVQELSRMKDELIEKDPATAVEAIAALPGPEGADQLYSLTSNSTPEVRRQAAEALAEKDPENARQLVEKATKGEASSDAGFQAALGLARHGDRDEIKRVSGWLPTLQGRDRFQAAGALSAAGSTEGTKVLTEIAQKGADDMLQLEAAAALAQVRPEIAAEVVERALASPNVWVRGQAASVAARLGDGWSERVRGILEQDSSSWVRLQAATGVLRR